MQREQTSQILRTRVLYRCRTCGAFLWTCWLKTVRLFSSGGEARQRDGSLPSHGVSASHPQAAHVRGAVVIPLVLDLRRSHVAFVWTGWIFLAVSLLESFRSSCRDAKTASCCCDFAPLVAECYRYWVNHGVCRWGYITAKCVEFNRRLSNIEKRKALV